MVGSSRRTVQTVVLEYLSAWTFDVPRPRASLSPFDLLQVLCNVRRPDPAPLNGRCAIRVTLQMHRSLNVKCPKAESTGAVANEQRGWSLWALEEVNFTMCPIKVFGVIDSKIGQSHRIRISVWFDRHARSGGETE